MAFSIQGESPREGLSLPTLKGSFSIHFLLQIQGENDQTPQWRRSDSAKELFLVVSDYKSRLVMVE